MTIDNTGYLLINGIIVLLYALSIFSSYKKGLVYGLISFAYFFIVFGVAWFLTPILSEKIQIVNVEKLYNLFDISPIINYFCWFVVIVFVLIVVYVLITPLLKSIPELPIVGYIDKIGGAIFGVISGTILAILLNLFIMTPIFHNSEEIRENTLLKYVNLGTNKIVEIVTENIDLEKISDQINEFNINEARDAFKLWLEEQGFIDNE